MYAQITLKSNTVTVIYNRANLIAEDQQQNFNYSQDNYKTRIWV